MHRWYFTGSICFGLVHETEKEKHFIVCINKEFVH